ncbi:SHOCT domain-containing protein [Hymenobacter sp. HDW8]|uniref:SHOCT domain-containing protein n=1 Tax=Hymenobacter sp. HDW8 TaxID=2714932 RepID=UPI00140D606D|nr:SHOCT domain-containing protein [Hymenobacter sp. HDW8]QIL75902.1 SHOCT domain-containing protein [Hymenobacter sp. HDW8]
MENEPSALATLRQLKEWLDAGAITPAEFEVLKRKLLFSDSESAASAPPSASSATPLAPSAPVSAPPTAVPTSTPLPPPPPSWDFKHDPNVTVQPVDNPVPPPASTTPVHPDFTPRPAASTPPVPLPPIAPPVVPVPPVVPPREQSQAPPKSQLRQLILLRAPLRW